MVPFVKHVSSHSHVTRHIALVDLAKKIEILSISDIGLRGKFTSTIIKSLI